MSCSYGPSFRHSVCAWLTPLSRKSISGKPAIEQGVMRLLENRQISRRRKNKMPFDAQPTLKGSLVRLRPLSHSDKNILFSVAADPLIWAQHPASNRHIKSEFDTFFTESIESRGALLVFDAQSETVIGSSRYFGFSEKNSDVEIGWTFLARSHWGGKYNGELKRLMLDHAFGYVDTVVFYIDPGNSRSQRSVEKIGGVRDTALDHKGRVVFRVEKSKFNIEL